MSSDKTLYNNLLALSRNKIFYTKYNLADTFENRIYLIFIHISFLFIRAKTNPENNLYKDFYQKTFDLLFNKIEVNMREIGYGDVTVNKNMKSLVNVFYDILLKCEKYKNISSNLKKNMFDKYLKKNVINNGINNNDLIKYFDKFEAFCVDLSSDSVLKGEINFKIN